ncbi:MAG: amidohydrolase [Myxococcaceae bacterium]|nr:amidohydrolase [Myxococcaceae bacterium]
MLRPLLALVLLCGCPASHVYPALIRGPATPASVPLVFHDVRVFTATEAGVLEHQDVVVVGDRIVSIAATGGALAPNARLIEGAGKTLLPGLVDFHVHLTGTPSPPWHVVFPDLDHTAHSLLYAGITTVQDVGGDLDALEELKAKAASGQWLGPHFTYAGKIITPDGSYPASYMREALPWPVSSIAAGRFSNEIDSESAGIREVEQRIARGASIIKVAVAQVPLHTPVYTRALLEPIVKAAHARGVRVVAHTDSPEHALLAARSGVDALVHGIHLGELTVEQAQELKALGVVVSPTIDVFNRIQDMAEFKYAPTPLEQEIYPADYLAQFSPAVVRGQKLSDGMMEWIVALQQHAPHRAESVKRMYEAGIPIFAGSDASGSAACWAGGALIDELALLVKAGLPPTEVLLGATVRPARWIDAKGDWGMVSAGARADLILVDGDPVADIAVMAKVTEVLKSGVRLERLRPAVP